MKPNDLTKNKNKWLYQLKRSNKPRAVVVKPACDICFSYKIHHFEYTIHHVEYKIHHIPPHQTAPSDPGLTDPPAETFIIFNTKFIIFNAFKIHTCSNRTCVTARATIRSAMLSVASACAPFKLAATAGCSDPASTCVDAAPASSSSRLGITRPVR